MRHFIFFLFQITIALGHGGFDEQIAKLSSQIAATPNDPTLLLARADLHQSHRDPRAALLDLQQATRIEPPHPPAFLKLAQFQRKLGHHPEAQTALTAYFNSTTEPDPLAHREKALLSKPHDSIKSWRLFLKKTEAPSMHDYTLAAQAALDAKNEEAARKFLVAGFRDHPKSIQLHQIHAQISLARNDPDSAAAAFETLQSLYPNLLVKLKYEESLIWTEFHHPARSRQALLAALLAYQNLPARLQKNKDLQDLATKIHTSLRL